MDQPKKSDAIIYAIWILLSFILMFLPTWTISVFLRELIFRRDKDAVIAQFMYENTHMDPPFPIIFGISFGFFILTCVLSLVYKKKLFLVTLYCVLIMAVIFFLLP